MTVSESLRKQIAPTGVLRAALNHGNRILVSREADGSPSGITVDLAQELASELALPLSFVEMEQAKAVADAATGNVFDICFLAVDPKRAETISFTQPYVQIEGSYLAGVGCKAADADALATGPFRVGTVEGSAYTLTLARKPGAGNLCYYPEIGSMLSAFDAGELDAVAGIKLVMEKESEQRSGSRVLTPPFMEIRQAMGMPVGRPEAAEYLSDFVDRMKQSGRIGEILERHGVSAECVP